MSIMTYREAINAALAEELARDETVFLLGEDVGKFGGPFAVTKGLYDRFGGRRVMDTPISESAIIGGALGSALTGLRPIAEIMYIDFTAVCFDQIINQVAKIRYMLGGQVKVPLVIRTTCGAGRSNAAQHSQSLEALFVHLPGIKVVMPSTPYAAKGLLKSAVRDDNPVMFIEHRLLYNEKGEVPEEEYLIPLGKAALVSEGNDLTMVAHSRQVMFAQKAAARLAGEDISVELIDLQSLNPLDWDAVETSVRKTGRLVTVEEGYERCGIGAEIAAHIGNVVFEYLDAPVERVAGLNCPVPFNRGLESTVIPGEDRIVAAARKVLQ